MIGGRPFTAIDVGAYLDGEMADAERASFEARLASDTELRHRTEAFRSDRTALKAVLDPVLAEPAPAHLVRMLEGRDAARRPRLAMQALAAALLLAIGVAAGWSLATFGRAPAPRMADTPQRALDAHLVYVSEVAHPVEVGVDRKDHLVAWLSKRLGHRLVAPDLAAENFQLIGGRLLPGGDGAAAQFMYQDATGLRTTLYVALNPEGRETAFRLAESGGTRTFYWLDGQLGYAITADVDEDRLLKLARIVYDQTIGKDVENSRIN